MYARTITQFLQNTKQEFSKKTQHIILPPTSVEQDPWNETDR